MDSRIEKKFLCNQKDFAILKSRIENLMQTDKNATENGYVVRSIYFDDIYNTCFFENEDGVDNRKKYRVRSYNFNKNYINLECKSKKSNYTNKISTKIDIETYHNLLDDDDLFNFCENKLLNRVNLLKTKNLLRKSLIIDYCRQAYIYEEGNVRVTFDMDIRVSNDFDGFFEEKLNAIPILQTGQFILEVKYDEYLPKTIAQALELNNLQQITFSKFYFGKNLIKTMEGGLLNGI